MYWRKKKITITYSIVLVWSTFFKISKTKSRKEGFVCVYLKPLPLRSSQWWKHWLVLQPGHQVLLCLWAEGHWSPWFRTAIQSDHPHCLWNLAGSEILDGVCPWPSLLMAIQKQKSSTSTIKPWIPCLCLSGPFCLNLFHVYIFTVGSAGRPPSKVDYRLSLAERCIRVWRKCSGKLDHLRPGNIGFNLFVCSLKERPGYTHFNLDIYGLKPCNNQN